jgi:hypothetical protein
VTRLDSVIERLSAQRACLDWAVGEIAALEGPVLEIGLGNGRSYDHLRTRLPASRTLLAFDRALAAHPDCVPPADCLILGDIRETLPALPARGIAPAALAHSDIGSGEAAETAERAAWLAAHLPALVRAGGIVASDQPLDSPELIALDPPPGVARGRYHLYRRR